VASDETGKTGGSPTSLIAFGFVWIAGIVLSLLTFRLAISGRPWDLGFPSWLITLSLLVGLWQWISIAPMLTYARRNYRTGMYNGLLRGGMSFSVLQFAIALVLYFMFRKSVCSSQLGWPSELPHHPKGGDRTPSASEHLLIFLNVVNFHADSKSLNHQFTFRARNLL